MRAPGLPFSSPSPRLLLGVALLLALIATVLQLAWLSLSSPQARDDDVNLYAMSLCVHDVFRGLPPHQLTRCVPSTPYPPLIPALAALRFLLQGARSLPLAVQSLSLWWYLLPLSLFLLLRHRSPQLALAAAALGPALFSAEAIRGRLYTELPLATLCILATAAWLSTGAFRRPSRAALLGLTLAAGLLTKWTFAFFLAPPLALAAAAALYTSSRERAVALFLAVLPLASASLLVLGLVQHQSLPLIVAGCVAAMVPIFLLLLAFWQRRRPEAARWLHPHALSTLAGLSITLAVTGALVLPWYLQVLPDMQRFLGMNLVFAYAGDRITPLDAWAYYPAVLLTQLLPSPLALLFLLGLLRLCLPGGSREARASALVLGSGLLLLTLFPYRTDRYLVAGLALSIPIMLEPFLLHPWLTRLALPPLLALGLFHQQSWLVPPTTDLRPPTWHILTGPPKGLAASSREGALAARQALLHPSWSLPLLAPAPLRDGMPVGRLLRAMAAWAGGNVPFYLLVHDPSDYLNADSFRVESEARGFPSGSRTAYHRLSADPDSLAEGVRKTLPPVVIGEIPCNLFMLCVFELQAPLDSKAGATATGEDIEGRELTRLLKTQGFRVLARDRLPNGRAVQLWRVADPACRPLFPPPPPSPRNGGE